MPTTRRSFSDTASGYPLAVCALLAGSAPVLLAYNLPPSPTLLNQCVAVALWGWFVAALMPALGLFGAGALQAALAAMALGIAASFWPGALPGALTLSALALVLAAALAVWAGAHAASLATAVERFGWFALGLLMAGLLSALVALVQVFMPDWPDGDFIARSGLAGRAVGNLRQPNHLSALLVWALVAAAVLHELGWLRRSLLLLGTVVLCFALVLSGSRTGALGLGILALWGLMDRRLHGATRLALLATPLIYALALWAMAHWLTPGEAYGAAARIAGDGGGDMSSSRFGIWSNTWELIKRHPVWGVGFGEFNLAWSLTVFPGRPVAFFDHTHNLPLQLAVELGLPLAGLILGALALALGQAGWRAWRRADAAAPAARAALVMVLLVGLHSLLEYPLWYAYFLLPAAFAWGFALGRPGPATRRAQEPAWAGLLAGLLLAAGGALAVVDYLRVVVIFAPPQGAASLNTRIERGQASWLFAHHADYAAATHSDGGPRQAQALRRAPHYLMDTRLMMAWVQALQAAGQLDRARWLAQRLGEFRNPAADEFFAECATPQTSAIQCQLPEAPHDWREFLQ